MAGMTEPEKQPGANTTGSTNASTNPIKFATDPFSAGKTADNSLFSPSSTESKARTSSGPPRDRRQSKEWDAAKVPPSKFQKPEGSIYATPGSRGQLGKDRDKGFHEKLKTMLGKS
ncbi:hypothetical protein MMC31_006226 [Peltigera leucophlebia]|nr:hypothetical protein [Peltigera leucophlebia]